jgi:integrase
MPKLRLTDRYIITLKAPAVRLEITDLGCRNLVLRCSPSGLKTWTYAYTKAGKMHRIALGEYPAISLERARESANQRRAQRKAGSDLRIVQAQEKAAQENAALTFAEVCDRYIKYAEANGKLSWKTDEGYLKRPKAKFGKRAVASITKREILDFLETIAKTSKSSANRTQSTVRTVWGWAADRDYIPMNFLAGIKKVGGKETEKDRVLTSEEIKTFLIILADEKTKATPAIRLALRAVLLTAQRPGEVAGMMLSELHDLEGEKPHWIIPRLRTKNKKTEHTVPLSPSAVRLIVEALKTSKKEADEDRPDGTSVPNDQPVFASRYEGVAALARNSLSKAVQGIVADNDSLEKFTPHDLRRTGATLAQSLRIPTDFVKALLNHNDKGVTGIYARWHMFEEKLETVKAIEAAVLPLMPKAKALAA